MEVIAVIPARYKSSRFPGKPLAEINGIPMIKRTYEQVIKSELLDKTVVATDDDRIYDYCEKEDINVVMTSSDCLTGTDRVAEVADVFSDYDLYVNVQGDEPVISPEVIEQIVNLYKEHKDNYIAYNAFKKLEFEEEINSDTIIKVLLNEDNELIYMSRLAVPYNKASTGKADYYKQVCVYGFTKKALELFAAHSKTRNEQFEDIEILRFIDLGYKIKMVETDYDSIAVDVPEDVEKVENYLEKTQYE